MLCPKDKPTLNDCVDCQADNQMPKAWCCLIECNEHDVCKKCSKGANLNKGESNG